jgi:helicase MOV-10
MDERIDFSLWSPITHRTFIISRTLRAIVGDPSVFEEFAPHAAYRPRVRRVYEPEPDNADIVEGPKPVQTTSTQWVKRLPVFAIPASVARACADDASLEARKTRARALMPKVFTPETHAAYFSKLLHFEELQEKCVDLGACHRPL